MNDDMTTPQGDDAAAGDTPAVPTEDEEATGEAAEEATDEAAA